MTEPIPNNYSQEDYDAIIETIPLTAEGVEAASKKPFDNGRPSRILAKLADRYPQFGDLLHSKNALTIGHYGAWARSHGDKEFIRKIWKEAKLLSAFDQEGCAEFFNFTTEKTNG